MKILPIEKFLENIGADVYPVTLLKFVLNKKLIRKYLQKVENDTFENRRDELITLDSDNCMDCKEKKSILCRHHTSTSRIFNSESALYDVDTDFYLLKNEIFRMVGNRLLIVYCPHTKLLTGDVTSRRAVKVFPFVVECGDIDTLPKYKKLKKFNSFDLQSEHLKCWFNWNFSIVTLPPIERDGINWCLIPNM